MFSSGKHVILNTQPYALIRSYVYDGVKETGIEARFTSRAEAEEAVNRSANEWVEFDPNVIDSMPLHNVPNPYLYALRNGIDGFTFADWYEHLVTIWAESEVPATVHAREVLIRYKRVFRHLA